MRVGYEPTCGITHSFSMASIDCGIAPSCALGMHPLTVALHHSCLTLHCRQYCTMAMLIFCLLWHCTSPVLLTTAHHYGYASISTNMTLSHNHALASHVCSMLHYFQSPLYAVNQMHGPAFSTIRTGIYIIRCQCQQETWKIPNLWTVNS